MSKTPWSAVALISLAGSTRGQSLDFRVVERTNHSQVLAPDPTLDFAVQARVTSTIHAVLSGFSFNVRLVGEPDTYGTLRLGTTSNSDGTYSSAISVANPAPVVGVHGLARQYTYLANISPSFNGLINASEGSFTNTPENQEIGLIAGAAVGTPLLTTPGVDPLADGNPSTFTPYGVQAVPAANATALMIPAIGAAFFGDGQYVDLFRFQYTVTNLTSRQLTVTIDSVTAETATDFVYNFHSWGLNSTTLFNPTITPASITIGTFPSPSTAAAFALGGVLLARRRRAPVVTPRA